MGGLRVKGGQLIDFNSLYAEVEKLLPGKELLNPRELITCKPQERQRDALKACGLLDWLEGTGEKQPAIADWIGYGGAAYGGKTYLLLMLALVAAYAYPGVQIGYFRRTYSELEGAGSAIHEAYEIYAGVAIARDSGKVWHFGDTGSSLYFQHCEHEQDVYAYQSKQFDILIMDEATHFTWFQVDYLKTRNRVSGNSGIPKPFCVLASNPGNIGHGWYMQMFDLERMSMWLDGKRTEPLHVMNPNSQYSDTFFIPSFIQDNQIGVQRDPDYEKRLWQNDPDLAEALIRGDWKVFSGMAFRQFDKVSHVIKYSELPEDFKKLPKWRAVDWGYDAPFCCLWGAHDPGTGRVYVYRELYESGLTDAQQAQAIVLNSPAEEHISITYGDPISFRTRHSRGNLSYTSADEYLENGVPIWNADNDRVGGKRKIDQRLATIQDGKPGLMIVDGCVNLIRTLPKLSRSKTNPEDVDKDQETHSYDTLRYLLTNVGMHSKKQGEGKRSIEYNPYLNIRGI